MSIATLDPLLRERDVARMLDVSIHVIRRERYAGRIPWVRIGKEVRIRQSSLHGYLKAQERCPAQTEAHSLSERATEPNGTSNAPSPAAARVESQRARQIAKKLSAS